MTERVDAIVIGAGHNGLVCATTLAKAGLDVLCVEASGATGGMAAPGTFAGDYGTPGLAHVAFPLAASLGRELDLDRFGYAPGPAVETIVLDANGRHLTIGPDRVAGDALSAADAAAYPAFRKQYLEFASALRPLFESRPPRLKGMPFADKTALAKLGWSLRFGLGRDDMYEFLRVVASNIFDLLNDSFEDERLKAGIALDAVLGSAMGPRTPGTVLTWLQRLYGELGGPLSVQPAGDKGLPAALSRAAEAAGVTLRCNVRVERILVGEDDAAVGVELAGGETIASGLVVSNADPRATFTRLVGESRLDAMFANRVAQIRGRGVVARLHLALRDRPGFTGLDADALGQRLLVAPSMRYIERAFNPSKYGKYAEDPVLEIMLPSAHDPALAPAGHHVMSINVAYAPYDLAGGWEQHRSGLTDCVIRTLEQYAPGIESLLAGQELLTPEDVETRYGAVQGHWHHGELSIHQSFMLRPLYGAAQYDTPIDGLYLCGAGCHPGGGITGLPGRNAAKRILDRRGDQ